MKATYQEFSARVSHYWSVPPHCYGSIQYAAQAAKTEFEEKEIENTQELFDEYKKNHQTSWMYAGD